MTKFDAWRANYRTISTEAHAKIYSESFAKDPQHASFSGRAVRVFLGQIGGPPEIAEIGGRSGSLAKLALDSTPAIVHWTNYDICPASIGSPATSDPRYEGRLMADFRWWEKEEICGNALIMTHFIEHLSDEDAISLIKLIPRNIRAVHIQAPIAIRGPMDWAGFNGAHILSMGWRELDDLFFARGFKSMVAYDGASWVRR